MTDTNGDGASLTVKNFKVINPETNAEASSTNSFPQNFDGNSGLVWVDFALDLKYLVKAKASTGATSLNNEVIYCNLNESATVSAELDDGFLIKDVLDNGTSIGSNTTVSVSQINSNHDIEFIAEHQAFKELIPAEQIEYAYFEGTWNSLPDFGAMQPIKTGKCDNFTLDMRDRDEQFGIRYSGYIYVDKSTKYTFSLGSDDGSKLWIGNTVVVDNDGLHGANSSVYGSVYLEEGYHEFTLDFFENQAAQELYVWIESEDIVKRKMIDSELVSYGGETNINNKALVTKFSPAISIAKNQLTINYLNDKSVELVIYDLTGKKIVEKNMNTNKGSISLNLKNRLANGYYICRVRNSINNLLSSKFLFVK